jgi:predicted acylesterase/phospholipase RssA
MDSEAEGRMLGSPRPILAIFEGGGAKGIAHVGALQAIEDNGLEIVGVAGTSAGALVATLVAIGLEATDIMAPDDPGANILARYGLTPVGLLGEKDWKRFKRVLRKGGRALRSAAVVGGVVNFLFAPRVMTSVALAAWRYGHFSTDAIAPFINQVVRDRLIAIREEAGLPYAVPDQVTFRVLGRGWPTVLPLKIVATDVDRGELEIFDADSTPDVVVAEAVAASVAIPLVFRPATIPSLRPGRFADGGLVANFPIWAVAEDKLGYERAHATDAPVPIVGFSLRQEEDGEEPRSPRLDYIAKLGAAALQGSQGAVTRFLDDVAVVPLETSLTTLDFDRTWAVYREAREAGRVSADRHLRFTLEVKPDRIKSELATVRAQTLALINGQRRDQGDDEVNQLRVNLITPFGRRSLRVIESIHMQEDADDRLLLDRRGRGAAEAFRERGLRVFRLGTKFEDRDLEYMTKHERALVRVTVQAVVCVPIFADPGSWALDEPERPEPAGVLAIDSDAPLAEDFRRDDVQSVLVEQSAVLYGALSLEVGSG